MSVSVPDQSRCARNPEIGAECPEGLTVGRRSPHSDAHRTEQCWDAEKNCYIGYAEGNIKVSFFRWFDEHLEPGARMLRDRSYKEPVACAGRAATG